MKISNIKYTIKNQQKVQKQKIPLIKTNDLISITFFNIFLKKLRIKTIKGICIKKKLNYSIKIKNKIRKDKIKFFFHLNSPIILSLQKNNFGE